MFRLYAKKVVLEVNQREIVTSNSVNVYQCQFQFDNSWDGLEKTAVFQAGEETVSTLLDETGICVIPWEVLQDAKRTLYAGVYGTKDGNIVLPTIWASLGEIKPGVTQGENTQPPTPDVYSQILQVAKDAEDVAQSVRDDADSGKFNGEQGPTGPQGYTYTPAVSEEGVISWTNDGSLPNPSPVNIKGPQGKQGIQGVQGKQGIQGVQGKQGERGYVYTPNVSQDGIISWTNDGDLENPDPVDIRGPEGPQGGQGEQGIQGPRGYTYTPSVGEDGTVSWTNDGNLPNPDPVNITGPQGETGETPDITAGTVETLEPGQDATAEITGETPNLVLNLGIPKGQPGQDAPQIDDSRVSSATPWSSRQIVDTLAPEFEASGAVVTCTPVAGYPLHVVSQIMPVQGGEGDPSPDNMRPISGWDSATLTHNDTPITIQLGQTIYGGTLDAVTGEVSEEWKLVEFDGTETWYKYSGETMDGMILFVITIPDAALGLQTSICNQFKNLNTVWVKDIPWTYSDHTKAPNKYFCVQMSKFPDVDSWKSYLAAQYAAGTPVQVCYKLDTPQPIQATGGQTIPALSGTNTIYTDTGDTTVSGRADPNTIIQQLAARIAALEEQAING